MIFYMSVIVDFLTDAAKIIFGSAIVGFFIPGISGSVTTTAFFSGIVTTAGFLVFASVLSKNLKQS